jgi:hypothetical protein
MGEAMARQNYSHTADIVKATLPYFDPRTRPKVEFMSKLLDLMGSLNIFGRESMVAFGYETINIDMEGLLNGIRPLCDSREREFIDRILNIFNMKRAFEMYNNFMNVMNTMQGFGGFSSGNSENRDDTDTVTGNFTGSNFDSIFQAFANSSDVHKETEEKETNPPPHEEKQTGGFAPNDAMFDMLRGMVPAEQQSTFENLRMLFSTMSYDNNRKSDDSKEHSDG